MTPQEMKESILWNAIQGKYTSQREDESVSDVIGESPLTYISDEEAYFEIPANWRWAKIGDIFDLVNGKAFKPTDWSEQGVPIVRIQNLNDPNAPYNCFSGEIEEKYMLNGGELLFSWSGTPGTSFGAFIWKGGKAVLNQHIFIVYPKIHLDLDYTKYALNAELRIFIAKAHGGAGLKHITRKEFDSCYLPIPPLAEQKRIVAKIEELLPYIDRYEVAWSRLEDFNKRFPTDMQKSILQLAIQGKLVPQRPEEGTGEALYQQIQAEKQSLIRSGKLKKEKPLPEITLDEIPFDIPESWKWVHLNDVSFTIGDIDHKMPEKISGKGIPYISPLDFTPQGIDYDRAKQISLEDYELLGKKIKPEQDDIIFPRYGTIGVVRMVDTDRPFLVSYSCCTIKNMLRYMYPKYIFYVLKSPMIQDEINKYINKTTQPNVGLASIKRFLFPLPSLAEQKRIVAKLEELLPMCNNLM